MRRIALLLIMILPSLGGCGGYYIMTVPDQLAKSGGEIVPVARMQRNDFFVLSLAVAKQPLRFRIYPTRESAEASIDNLDVDRSARGLERACSTDDLGYAAVSFPAKEPPIYDKPNTYFMKVALQDVEGVEKHAIVPVFVWDPKKPVVAVELDSLPRGFLAENGAAKALQNIAQTANIVYLTRVEQSTRDSQHFNLKEGGYPDGPVLLWQRERWHIVRDGKFNMPRIVVETRLVSQLDQLTQDFPKFRYGICKSELAAKTFLNSGLNCVVVGNAWLQGSKLVHRESWADLVTRGLPVESSPQPAP